MVCRNMLQLLPEALSYRTVKLCSNKLLEFLTGVPAANLHNDRNTDDVDVVQKANVWAFLKEKEFSLQKADNNTYDKTITAAL